MQHEEDTAWEAPVKQDEAVTTLNHDKMLRRLREMNDLETVNRTKANADITMDSILQDLTQVKKKHQDFLKEIKRARMIGTRALARQARMLERKPYPHPKPWSDSTQLDPDRTRLIPEAIASDPVLEFQEIKRVRKEDAAKHPSWKYPNGDRSFGEPPLYCCTDSFKKRLEAHLEASVVKISRSYDAMNEGTLKLSEKKADVGAELWLMKSALDEVRKGLKASRKGERLSLLERGKKGRKSMCSDAKKV